VAIVVTSARRALLSLDQERGKAEPGERILFGRESVMILATKVEEEKIPFA
jgi:hypothetical protein